MGEGWSVEISRPKKILGEKVRGRSFEEGSGRFWVFDLPLPTHTKILVFKRVFVFIHKHKTCRHLPLPL